MASQLRRGSGRLAVVGCVAASVAARAAEEPLPKLLPPRGELPPSFWEQNGWAVLVGISVALAVIVCLLVWLRRPKTVASDPPEVAARRDLEALRGRAEDGPLLVAVSRILRRHVLFAFRLPSEELTTSEIRAALADRRDGNGDVVVAVTDFLQKCDERKFSPAPPAVAGGVVAAALELFEKIEVQRRSAANPS